MSYRLSQAFSPGKRLVSFLIVLFILSLGIGIGTLITYRVGATGPGDSQLKIQTDGKPLVGGAVLGLSQAFEEVAKKVEPAVVNVNTEEIVRLQRRRGAPEEDPMDLFRRFFPAPNLPESFTRRSLGSGVIVDPKGYIITNDHVVSGASKIRVSVHDDKDYTAKVIASDQLTDIAVIKIDGNNDFPYAKAGDAKAMKVGDWVLAIGSPFGLEQTVTAGIISATGRVFDTRTADSQSMLYSDFLQTDAAINMGNSGGPLVNMKGEVVGINSFISTTSRSNAGVGFAVPSHVFVNVYNQILEKGKVARGWLGVSMNPLPFSPAMAKYFGVKQGSGVLINGLSDEGGARASDGGPAARAGVKPEDVIIEFAGKKIETVQDLRLAVANTPPGQTVPVRVVRFGDEKTFKVTVAERTVESQNRERGSYSFDTREEEAKPEIGLVFDDVPPRVARELDIQGGALVTSVKPGSLAEDAGLQGPEQGVPGDIIVMANGRKIATAQDLWDVVKGLKSGEAAVLKLLRITGRTESGRITTSTLYTSIAKP